MPQGLAATLARASASLGRSRDGCILRNPYCAFERGAGVRSMRSMDAARRRLARLCGLSLACRSNRGPAPNRFPSNHPTRGESRDESSRAGIPTRRTRNGCRESLRRLALPWLARRVGMVFRARAWRRSSGILPSPGSGRYRIARGASPERYGDNAPLLTTSQGHTARGHAPSGVALGG